jgi:hypothetical protein
VVTPRYIPAADYVARQRGQRCSSVEADGPHRFVDTEAPSFVSLAGEVRRWQRCTGCGNVQTRPVRGDEDTPEVIPELVEATELVDRLAKLVDRL